MKARLSLLLLLASAAPLGAQDRPPLWWCSDPKEPFRYITSRDRMDDPPPCRGWLQLRGVSQVLAELGDERFPAANQFLAQAALATDFSYPGAESGTPVTTQAVYSQPEAFGLQAVDVESAPVGSLVVYNGLGGVLVEARESEADEWRQQVLYPSAAANYQLVVGDVDIPGKAEPRALVE